MPESAAAYHARLRAHGDADGRLALPGLVDTVVDDLVSRYGGKPARG